MTLTERNNLLSSDETEDDSCESHEEEFDGEGSERSSTDNNFDCNLLDIIINEFDGTTVLCRVCGDKASGFHYGVHSCEGCKGFFRRSIQQKIQYRPCSKNQQCSILRVNRNRCQYCRLKKCITVGMSRDAVRFGRVPKREKAKILAAMQASHTIKNTESVLNEELMNTSELKATIVNAHLKTCEFTKGKLEQLVKSALVETKDSGNSELKTEGGIASATLSYLTCPLNPKNFASTEDNCDDNFSDRFSPAIRGVVEFAKLLPGFNVLTQDDQIILLKSGVFEVLLLRLSNMFLNGKMICINGKVVNINNIDEEGSGSGQSTSSAKFLIKSMFKFTNELNQWNLNDNIIGIFSSIVIMSWDRPGLQNPDLIKKIQSFYRHVLQTLLPLDLCNTLESMIPDLRALNTLHSAKLLSFKMEDRKKFEEEDVDMSMDTDELPSLSHSNQTGIQQCPYNSTNSMLTHFPVSPSDSGIESGPGSSPTRSETYDPPMYNAEESMPVLMKALLAPPIIDNQYISTNLNHYDKSSNEGSFKRMGSQDPEYNVIGHKKFRRTTHTPPSDMTRTPSPTPIQYENETISVKFGGMINQSKPEAVNDICKHEEKSPVQLYPQLASALTRPICTAVASAPVPQHPAPEMTTLKQSLLRPPMTSNAETSDYIHSLIMRNDTSAPKPILSNKRPIACLYDTNPSPLNLCMKSAPLNVNQMT